MNCLERPFKAKTRVIYMLQEKDNVGMVVLECLQ